MKDLSDSVSVSISIDLLLLAQSQDLGYLMEDLSVIHDSSKELRTRSGGKDGYILERVDTDRLGHGHGTDPVDAMNSILGVGNVLGIMMVRVTVGHGRDARDVDLEIFAVSGKGCCAGSQGIADVPFIRETVAIGIDIRGPARLPIGTYSCKNGLVSFNK